MLGGWGEWEFEVGEAPARVTIKNDTLRASSIAPSLVRNDRLNAFEWRIRNLPYPKSTYSVSIDFTERKIVVRTLNKKYFKRIDIADLDRAKLSLEEPALSWSHENNTLIIQYKKPAQIMQLEREAKVVRSKAPREAAQAEGEPECKQQ